ncbi:MAG: tRNA epoxyqueuosine(34) reductase QueG [Chloroflexi bacterium]|nr:tRNA epoxyqueuosine(34) reductase QueG [Chloroflexota bacterium]
MALRPGPEDTRVPSSLTDVVKALAREAGFDLVGIATAEPFTARGQAALQRVRDGLMDGLPWYTEERVRRGMDPRNLLPDARSLVSLGLSYYTPAPEGEDRPRGFTPSDGAPLRGRVARYAWGEDYHRVFERKMKVFLARLPEVAGRPVATRWYTDTGPMQDRAVAERAGIGWFGKNTGILTRIGSWVLLAHVLTDLELEPNKPLKKSCGACLLCMDACPTGALIAPGVLDNRRCIAYLTIENRGPIPRDLRPLLGDWVFGCDVCQDACPVNRKAQLGRAYAAFTRDGERARPELIGLLKLDESSFRTRFRGSPVLRATLTGLKRNVCVALGNIGDAHAVPALARALEESRESGLVRGHAAWALGRIGSGEALEALQRALAVESDPWIRDEIAAALGPSEPAKDVVTTLDSERAAMVK